MSAEEAPLEPQRQIIDPHLHLWEIRAGPGQTQAPQCFLFPELLATLEASGHAITHTVFVECHAMVRADGPKQLRTLGETEFANGVAAMSASGNYGPMRVAHRIVGNADLLLGEGVRPVVERHIGVAGERFAGIRMNTVFSAQGLWGHPCDPGVDGVMRSDAFIAGARVLAAMDLSLDIWCVHTQLADVIALADAVPDLTIVLDHIGTPECTGSWAGRGAEAFAQWSQAIAELARRPNVVVKIGGLGMDVSGPLSPLPGPATSLELAGLWRPRVETCIAAFGAERAMFESNFPPDQAAGTYGATWNAFKRIAAGCSDDEKDWLFRGTAAAVYRIELNAA